MKSLRLVDLLAALYNPQSMAQAVDAAKAKAMKEGRRLRSAVSVILFQILLVLGDGLVAGATFLLTYRLRMLNRLPDASDVLGLINPVELFMTISWPAFEPYLHLLLIAPVIRVISLRWRRLYDLKGEFSFLDDLINIFKAVTLASLIIIVVTFMYRGLFEFRVYSYSRGVFLLDWGLALIGYTALRGLVRTAQLWLRQRGLNLIPSIIVGQGGLAALCCREIASRPQLGYRIVGLVSEGGTNLSLSLPRYPTIGTLTELPQIIKTYGIEEVFITDPSISPRLLFETIMQSWRYSRTKFSLVPNLLNTLPRKTELDQIGALPMVKLFQEPLRGPHRYTKRTADIVMSALGLLLLSPLLLVIYVVTKLDSPGPAFFRQERVGMDGRVFTLYKFRTMRVDADDETHRQHMRQLINGTIAAQTDGEVIYGKVEDDKRVTRLGRILRPLSLDELPQLFNVLKGEMSIVGPRPPIPYEVEQYSDWHRKRLDVKPGITGLWQVSGRNRLPFDEMVQLDVYYIENWSLWLDFKIILQTLPAILRGETC
ncbi:MAG: sugar transferase [Acidobacteria bacterium]|nr:sugar transferase [Acidobacteriota bacterium]